VSSVKGSLIEQLPAEGGAVAEPKIVEAQVGNGGKIRIDLALAKRSCKHCYGTGLFGTRLHKDGTREGLLCSCVWKAHQARLKEKEAADGLRRP